MVRTSAALVVLIAVSLAATALPAPTTSPDELLAAARQLYFEQGPQVALPEFERVLALYRQAGDRHGEAITLGYIGNCHKRFGDLPKALDYLKRALAMKQELGDRLEEGKTLSHLGLVYWEMGEYAQAIDHLTRSIAIARELGDRQLEGASLNNLSLVYDEQGDYGRSLEQYQRVLELYRGTGFERGESDTLGNIGGVYLLLGHYREAMHYYQQSLAISERLGLKPSLSQDLGNLALCHLGLGQVPEALSRFDRALLLAREAGLPKEEADWRIGKGEALLQEGEYDAALQEYRQAVATYEQAGLQRERVEGLNELGQLYLLLGDVASAQQSFHQALEQARAIGHARGMIFNLLALGDLEWRQQRFEQAAALHSQALALARQADDQLHVGESLVRLALTHRDQKSYAAGLAEAQEAQTVAHQIGARLLEARARYALGELERARREPAAALPHFAAGKELIQPVGDPELGWQLAYGEGRALEALGRDEEAIAALQRAVTLIETVRSQLAEERFRSGYIEDKYEVYVALVRLLLKQGRIDDAFFVAEKLRARSYLDLFNRGTPPVRNEAQRQSVMELRQRIRQLQRSIEQESNRPQPEQRAQALEVFSGELVAAERDYQNLLDDLRRTEPAAAAAEALAVPPAQAVQQRLPPHAALLEYVVADDEVVIFVITREGVRAKSVPLRRVDLESKVELLRDLIQRRNSDAWRLPANSLASFLLEPVVREGWLQGSTLLYLVPHGILHYLPFAVLPFAAGAGGRRYLVEGHVLAYLPSATALVYGNESEGPPPSNLLALAPARSRLRYARQEARQVAALYPHEAKVLVGRAATEGSFKSEADDYGVIHLATHSTFNKLNPLLSGLGLEADGQEDGRLEVHEILGLHLHADLVTLSACDTALGSGYFTEVPAGDDFVGLTRAFLFAGTPSVLASLWEVDDRSTLQLMRSFYGQLNDADKATALARAQRAMLRRGGRYEHPYFWAPFVLVGEPK